nr:copia protein [Tanacetum cinerariifolium]
MPDSSPDNQTSDYSKQSLESENILLKKTVAQFQKDFSRMEAHCIALELKYQNQALKLGQHGQILNETSNKDNIEKEIDVLETKNIELEYSVAKLRKENETLKKHYKDLYDYIKITRSKTIEQTTSLLANNAELKAQIQRRESVFAKPDHMLASSKSRNTSKNMPRFSSNDMVHNHYLDEARKKTQETDRNSKTSVMPSARFRSIDDGSKPKLRSNNQTSRSLPEVNPHAMIQSHKTRNSNKPVDQKSHTQKPGRQIFTRHRFSPNKTSAVYEKTSPRSDVRWKPTGRIFKSVGLRWIPTGKLFDSCASKLMLLDDVAELRLLEQRLLLVDDEEMTNPQVMSTAKLPILNPNEFDLWKMRIAQYFLMTDYSLWEVILNGDSPTPTRVIKGVVQLIAPTTAEQRLARKNELKTCEKRFGGNKETKKHFYKNIAFVSSQNTDNTNETISAAASVSAASAKIPASALPNVNTLSIDVIYFFFASQSNSTQLDNDDLKQIDADDREEMDLKWQMAMLTVRKRQFIQRTEGILEHMDLLPWDLICPRWSATTNTGKDTLLDSYDGVCSYDWSFQAKEEPTNYALMAFTSLSSSSSDNEDDFEAELPQNTPGFVYPNKQVKTPMPSVKPVKNSIPVSNHKTTIPKPKSHGNSRNRKACIVCKSLTYLVKDLLTESKLVPITAARSVTAVVPKPYGNPHHALKDKGVIDSGCSTHMTGNITYLSDFEEINGGFIAFGGNPKSGKISGKGKFRTGKLDFDDVYFVKELKFNLFSVLRKCDKKNIVLFTDTECIVLSPEFKLLNENQVLLRVPRENNMYNVDLKNIVPSGDLTYPLGKFDGNVDEGVLVRYSVSSKSFRVFNSRTRIIQETLHINFLENKPNVAGSGPTWVFDIDTLTKTMNYQPITAGNQSNPNVGVQEQFDAEKAREDNAQQYVLFLVWSFGSKNPQNIDDAAFGGEKPEFERRKPKSKVHVSQSNSAQTKKHDDKTKTNTFSVAGPFNTAVSPTYRKSLYVDTSQYPDDPNMPELEDNTYYDDNEDLGAEADFTNLETTITVSPIPTIRVHKDHLVTQIIGDLSSATQTRSMTRVDKDQGTKWVFRNKKDERGIVVRNKARLVAQGHTQEEGIDYEEVFASAARIEAIRLFLDYASCMGFMVYQIDVKSAFLYGTIEKEVYVCQPPGFEDPDYPDKVYKVVKALYGLHQASRFWYETLVNYLLENGFQRGKIDKTLFIKRQKGDILRVQIYVDDIILGSTNKDLCKAFEKLIKDKFQMSLIGELTFFLGLQVKQKPDRIFISQDNYVVEILRKFGLTYRKSASTPRDTKKPLL